MTEAFTPDMRSEAERLEVAEQAIGPLIDRHLGWVERGQSPSQDLSEEGYGYVPEAFTPAALALDDRRPRREPVSFLEVASNKLSLPMDTPYHELAARVRAVDTGWLKFLVDRQYLDKRQVAAMDKAAIGAYRLNTHTEDNVPAYSATIHGGFLAAAKRYGLSLPGMMEWSRGIWIAEEDGHMLSMNDYGKVMGYLNDRKHEAGRNSQLRAGIEVQNEHVIQLFTFVTWQELSTNYAHSRDGSLLGPVGGALLGDISADEARHHKLYFDVLKALYEAFPDDVMQTLHTVLMEPNMPGNKGIPAYSMKAGRIHLSAIFGSEQRDEAVRTVLARLGVLSGNVDTAELSPDGVRALEQLVDKYGQPPVTHARRGQFVLGATMSQRDLRQARLEYEHELGLAV